MTDNVLDYFESEAVRSLVPVGDYDYSTAVAALADNNATKWMAWVAGADEIVKNTICAAYIDRQATVTVDIHAFEEKVLSAFDAEIAAGNKAFRTAKNVVLQFPRLARSSEHEVFAIVNRARRRAA